MTDSNEKILVLLRHGQSEWNRARRLTGWTDVALTDRGRGQAVTSAGYLRAAGFVPDAAYTSELIRARQTLDVVLQTLGLTSVEVVRDWRLNERHYGALEGLGPVRGVLKFGPRRFIACQRRFDVRPPALTTQDERFRNNQEKYPHVPMDELPLTESMEDTWRRLAPYWRVAMAPAVAAGRRLLVVSHKNALRVLFKEISGISGRETERLAIRTGQPLLVRVDDAMKLISADVLSEQGTRPFQIG